MKFEIGDKVLKVATDYTGGREGIVVEVGQPGKPDRVRVRWMYEKDGRRVTIAGATHSQNGLRTWCAPKTLLKIGAFSE